MSLFYRCILIVLTASFFGEAAAQSTELETSRKDVTFLASDRLKGREAGSKYELAAAKYIAKRFEDIGLQPYGKENTFFQSFELKQAKDAPVKSKKPLLGHNVIGFIDNKGRNTIIIGAHYDHIGYGAENSRYTGKKAVHNGADDNASGVAALLLVAEKLKEYKGASNNYLFIAFSAEEKGLLGSKYFVKNAPISLSKINCMLNMDMVGRLNEKNELIVNGTGTSPKWTAILDQVEVDDLSITTTKSGFGSSDHTSFYLKDIPVLSFFTGNHSDYHMPSDDADKINYQGIVKTADYVVGIVKALDEVLKMAYSKTKDEMVHSRRVSGEGSPKYKVTLGVMPDYTFSGQGMRIDGVIASRPADKAGMKEGDVVTKLGEMEVSDLQTYMKALGQFNPGDTTVVEFLRDGEGMKTSLEF